MAYCGDVADMFNRIYLDPKDTRKHRFIWQEPGESKIKVIQMNRLSFGDGSSPCVAIAADDCKEEKPEAIKVIRENFYMDDLLDSRTSIEKSNEVRQDVCDILKNGNFELRKWLSNHKDFELMDKDAKKIITVLGLVWNSEKDLFQIKEPVPDGIKVLTKRTILAKLAQVYSPLGLVSPFGVKGKIRLARLHLLRPDWDDNLELGKSEMLDKEAKWWRDWFDKIAELSTEEFIRYLRP